MTSVSSATGGAAAFYAQQKDMFSKTDTDQSGTLSQSEFVSARPGKMSEEDAASVYSKIDSDDTGAVTFDQLSASMQPPEARMGGEAMGSMMGMSQQGGMPPMAGMGGRMDPSEMFDTMDADADGKVTKDEFMSGAPEGSEDKIAAKMFSAMDSDSAGYITEDQLSDFAAKNDHGHMGPPPGGEYGPTSAATSTQTAAEEVAA
jgi:Ca2+-binding EF-hand superfamily protein